MLLPLLAMNMTDQVNWGPEDFVFAGILVAVICGAYDVAVWATEDPAYRGAVGVALGAGFLLVWLNAAVGIVGSEDNPVNLLYGGVVAVAVLGALLARCRAGGMARAMLATALAQMLVTLIALRPGAAPAEAVEILSLNGMFVILWLAAAWLFRRVRERRRRGLPS
ncbi:hypothetical protein [Roseitranquillus sediminis]|uniref:hypothetical protein n=1 Tax=Roseitranquillus sediminis TaxID=2809051 RepID=UPI001D0C9AAC|nr:hypothetical protein [Roseitranquillus sediminis]MBM9595973.1 hypothetical protein [Roseitranquillus sediminis]